MTTSKKLAPRNCTTVRELTYGLLLGQTLALAAFLSGCGPIDEDDGAALPVVEVSTAQHASDDAGAVPETPASAQSTAQACTTDADCVDGPCFTWYRDADRDGYGDMPIRNCSPTPPIGYVARGGDEAPPNCFAFGNKFPTNCGHHDEPSKR